MTRLEIAALAGLLVFATTPMAAQQKVLKGFAASPDVSVRLVAAVASVRVIAWDRDSVEMSGVVGTGARFDMMSGSPTGRAKGMKAYVEAPNDQSVREGKLLIRVPRGARVWLKTGSADIDVTGVTGGLDLNVVGGSITVHGNPRELRAECMDGNVIIDGVPQWVRAKTATGDITLRGGEDIGASTISGNIRSSGEELERAKFETTTGSISFSNAVSRNASIELETHSGPIDINLPLRADVEVDAATITGAIDNQWSRGRTVAGRENRGMTLTTSSGTGVGRITARSFKGTIQLRPR